MQKITRDGTPDNSLSGANIGGRMGLTRKENADFE
jgi:hypothetical protein